MDPELQALGVQLTGAALRNSAVAVTDRITAARARKRDQETITELEEIVYALQDDKSELVRIAQAYESELVSQRISSADIDYISATVIPVLGKLMEAGAAQGGSDPAAMQEMLDLLRPLLSAETVTVLQLLGFNFRKAIGEPLTEVVSRLILAGAKADPTIAQDLQRLQLQRETGYQAIALDPDAAARLTDLYRELYGQQ